MLRGLTARQFHEWIAYAELEPFDEERADMRVAMLASVLANVNRDSKKKKEPYKIEDFMLKFGKAVPKPFVNKNSWQVNKAIAMAIVAAYSEPDRKRTRTT
ncbi:MAG: DUF4035 domain-containing protein [Nitrospirales bacterium]